MGRSKGRAQGSKVKITVSIDPGLYEWVVENSQPGGTFASVSHAVERGIARLREENEAPALK